MGAFVIILGLGWLAYIILKEEVFTHQVPSGTERDIFRNNPRVQKERIGCQRLCNDLQNGVSRQERDKRRALGYYDGENV